jgi:hypothetical protein
MAPEVGGPQVLLDLESNSPMALEVCGAHVLLDLDYGPKTSIVSTKTRVLYRFCVIKFLSIRTVDAVEVAWTLVWASDPGFRIRGKV